MPHVETKIPIKNPNALSQDYEPLPADVALEELTRMNIRLYGHGTPRAESAMNILHDGLNLSVPDLGSTTMQMPTLEDDPDAIKIDKEQLARWPHRGHKFVAVLGVERIADEDIPHQRYMNAIVQEVPGANGDFFAKDYYIDQHFVAGYFDVNGNQFLPNPNFDPRFDPALLETTPDIYFAMQRRTTEDIMGGPVLSEISYPTILSEDNSLQDDEDIW